MSGNSSAGPRAHPLATALTLPWRIFITVWAWAFHAGYKIQTKAFSVIVPYVELCKVKDLKKRRVTLSRRTLVAPK